MIRLFAILSFGKRHSVHGWTCVHMCRPREFIADQRENGIEETEPVCEKVFGTNRTPSAIRAAKGNVAKNRNRQSEGPLYSLMSGDVEEEMRELRRRVLRTVRRREARD